MACCCGAKEKKCGGIFRTISKKGYYEDGLKCEECGRTVALPGFGDSDGSSCLCGGTYRKKYKYNNGGGVRCDSCGDFSYNVSKEGEKCTLGVCSKTGERTWVGCKEFEKQLAEKNRREYGRLLV